MYVLLHSLRRQCTSSSLAHPPAPHTPPQGYPTLQLFRGTEPVGTYSGPRTEAGLLAYAKRLAAPALVYLGGDRNTVAGHLAEHPVSFIWVQPGQNRHSGQTIVTRSDVQAANEVLLSAAKALHGDVVVATAEHGAMPSDLRISEQPLPALVRLEAGVAPVWYAGSTTSDALQAWMADWKHPAWSTLGPGNFASLAHSGRKVVAVLQDPTATADRAQQQRALVDAAKAVASGKLALPDVARQQFHFGVLDARRFHDYLSRFGITPESAPTALVLDVPNSIFWLDPSVNEQEELLVWLEDIAADRAPKQREGVLGYPGRVWTAVTGTYLPLWLSLGLGGVVLLSVLGAIACLCVGSVDPVEQKPPKKQA